MFRRICLNPLIDYARLEPELNISASPTKYYFTRTLFAAISPLESSTTVST